jgi:hypothetical protein
VRGNRAYNCHLRQSLSIMRRKGRELPRKSTINNASSPPCEVRLRFQLPTENLFALIVRSMVSCVASFVDSWDGRNQFE